MIALYRIAGQIGRDHVWLLGGLILALSLAPAALLLIVWPVLSLLDGWAPEMAGYLALMAGILWVMYLAAPLAALGKAWVILWLLRDLGSVRPTWGAWVMALVALALPFFLMDTLPALIFGRLHPSSLGWAGNLVVLVVLAAVPPILLAPWISALALPGGIRPGWGKLLPFSALAILAGPVLGSFVLNSVLSTLAAAILPATFFLSDLGHFGVFVPLGYVGGILPLVLYAASLAWLRETRQPRVT